VLRGGGGTDTFVFTAGRDRILDFYDDIDTIRIDRSKFSGTKDQLFHDAEIENGNAVFHLDGKHQVVVEGVLDLSDLRDDVFLF
jgi:serralysin